MGKIHPGTEFFHWDMSVFESFQESFFFWLACVFLKTVPLKIPYICQKFFFHLGVLVENSGCGSSGVPDLPFATKICE